MGPSRFAALGDADATAVDAICACSMSQADVLMACSVCTCTVFLGASVACAFELTKGPSQVSRDLTAFSASSHGSPSGALLCDQLYNLSISSRSGPRSPGKVCLCHQTACTPLLCSLMP